jgi:hypothetical protein
LLRYIIPAVAIIAVILAVTLAYSNWQYAGQLAEARAQVEDKIEEAKAASAESERALILAAEETARADSAEQAAEEHAARARAMKDQRTQIASKVPADSIEMLAQLIDERNIAVVEAASWEAAYEDEKRATASLRIANDTLTKALKNERAASGKLQGASQKLVDASKRSFWDRFAPKASINVTVGVEPLQPEQGVKKVVGVGLSWAL